MNLHARSLSLNILQGDYRFRVLGVGVGYSVTVEPRPGVRVETKLAACEHVQFTAPLATRKCPGRSVQVERRSTGRAGSEKVLGRVLKKCRHHTR